jgi:EmrB/QacA subfamily drug resistance transporter
MDGNVMIRSNAISGPSRGARSRWVALHVLCVGTMMNVLDGTIVTVGLSAIQDELGFSDSSLAWVVNAYLIAFGGLLLLAGRLGDLVGRRTVFVAGVAIFTGASLLCGLAQTRTMLIAARFVQGVGGAMTSAVVLGLIVRMFPEPREQARAMGVYALVASAGGSLGLLAGGVLTSINWYWLFFVNVPIGIATAALAVRLIDRDDGIGVRAGADLVGAALITTSLMVAVYTVVKPAVEEGWSARMTLWLGATSLTLLVAFVARQATARAPLVPLRIFRSRSVVGAYLIAALCDGGLFGSLFLGSLYLQRILGYSALKVGASFLPMAVGIGTISVRYSGRLITRFGAKTLQFPGLALAAGGLVLFARAPETGTYISNVLPAMVLLGLGTGIAVPALMTLAMSGATDSDAGLASGLANTAGQVGGALGLAVLAGLSSSRSDSLKAEGRPTAVALTGGYHLAFWVTAALMIAAMAVALVVVVEPKAPRARDPAPGASEPESSEGT